MDASSLNRLDKSELITLVLALDARVAALEAKLGQPPKTPDNSSLPPSRGQKANRAERRKLKRKGRLGVARQLCPAPDEVRGPTSRLCLLAFGMERSILKRAQ